MVNKVREMADPTRPAGQATRALLPLDRGTSTRPPASCFRISPILFISSTYPHGETR
jgi:hypothetical protein